MGMPPPPPRFDAVVRNPEARDAKSAMPPPPPLFSERDDRVARQGAETRAPPPSATADPPSAPPPAPAGGGYVEPEWGGLPSSDFSLEVLKDGAIVDVVDCRGRSRLALGRTPDNDVVLEHPSSSRLHAVLQFSEGGDEIFLYDAGSTHGTFVNRRKLKSRVHAPVFVGDQIRFGQSSRTFIVAGAQELMPEEGLSRDERRKLRALEKMSEEEATRALQAEARAKAAAAAAAAADGASARLGRRRRPRARRRRRARARDARLARTPRRLHRKTTRKDRKDSKERGQGGGAQDGDGAHPGEGV